LANCLGAAFLLPLFLKTVIGVSAVRNGAGRPRLEAVLSTAWTFRCPPISHNSLPLGFQTDTLCANDRTIHPHNSPVPNFSPHNSPVPNFSLISNFCKYAEGASATSHRFAQVGKHQERVNTDAAWPVRLDFIAQKAHFVQYFCSLWSNIWPPIFTRDRPLVAAVTCFL
jgi:hypothetical protein